MQLGISSWTYPWAIGVPGYPPPRRPLCARGLLNKASSLGVEVVQIADNFRVDVLSAEELREIRAKARERQLTLELGMRGVEPQHLLRYLELAVFLDVKLLRTIIQTSDSQPDLDQVVEWVKAVLPEFEAAGVSLAFENYERYTVRQFAELVRRLQSPCVGICLDTVNSLGALETPAQAVAVLAPYVLNLHVKDFDIVRVPQMMGYSVVGRPAGEGRLDVRWILDEVLRHGRDPSVIVELWPPFLGSVEDSIVGEQDWAERSVQHLQGLLLPVGNRLR